MIKISGMLDTGRSVAEAVEAARLLREAGFDAAFATQTFGLDTLSMLAVVGAEVPGIELGTAVVPVHSRLPQTMAQQALTVQSASGGRLSLGIGLSHQMVVEGLWGQSYDRPARYMAEYLEALVPMLNGEAATLDGELLRAKTPGPLAIDAPAPSLLLAALGPAMLRLAGSRTDGTVTWMTGIRTVGEHIVPRLSEAAAAAGRPSPRVVVALPLCLTSDPARAAELIDTDWAHYPSLPSYKAMLEREGASRASDISLIGSAEQLADGIGRLEEAGGTELGCILGGTPEEKAETSAFLGSLSARG
jgi:F420-dependent oxidoreductase-like protein